MRAPSHRATGRDGGDLAGINAELAAVLHLPPCDLNAGADATLADELVVCGILGGKDVGKSTLINALAQERISQTDEEIGPGTTRPVAFIHKDAIDAYTSRLNVSGLAASGIEFRKHDADAIRNIVLIDMPDFDSDIPRHLDTVQSLSPLLDRIIWVVTPRKIADRIWVEILRKTLKHHDNVHCVLNKADELLGDDAYIDGIPPDFVAEQRRWALRLIEQAGYPDGDGRFFVCAAEYPTAEQFERRIAERWDDPDWARYGTDREQVRRVGEDLSAELQKLRSYVLSPVSGLRMQEIKRANRLVEVDRNKRSIAEHYRLDGWIDRLEGVCNVEEQCDRLNAAFGREYAATVGRRLAKGMRSETELADELLAERVELWPILPIIFWPLRGIVRRLGARFAGSRWTATDLPSEAFTVLGQSLCDRIADFRERLCSDAAIEIEQLRLLEALPEPEAVANSVERHTALLVSEIDDTTLEGLKQTYRRPSFVRRWALWLVLLWFPFLQPISAGVLNILGAGGSIDILSGLAQIVTALSAVKLLTGFLFSLLVYVIVLATMYARCVAAVRKARRRKSPGSDDATVITDGVDNVLVSEIVGKLTRPFSEVCARLVSLRERLSRVS